LLTTILADAINLGLTKMAESCTGASYANFPGFRYGTSAMRLMEPHWPISSMLNCDNRCSAVGAMAPRPRQMGNASRLEEELKAQATST